MKAEDVDRLFCSKLEHSNKLPSYINWTPEKGWNSLKSANAQKKHRLFRNFGIAASVVVLVGLGLTVWFANPAKAPDYFVVVTGANEKTLVDINGNAVWLNKNSYIMYPSELSAEHCDIHLEGEAYFDFSACKFFVNLKVGNTLAIFKQNVLMVKAENNERISFTSIRGNIQLRQMGNYNFPEMMVKQGEKAEVVKETAMFFSNCNDKNLLAWVTGVLKFENTPLPDVFAKLDELYGTETKLENEKLYKCLINRRFEKDSLNGILQKLQKSNQLNIRRNGRSIEVSGGFCL